MTRVLVVDDDARLRLALRKALGRKGVSVVEAEDGRDALPLLRSGRSPQGEIDICVLDLRMRTLGGIQVLRETPKREVPVVVLTGHGTIPDAVEAMRLGAANFVQKPVDADELWPILQQTLGLRARVSEAPDQILGKSQAMLSFLEQLDRAAKSDESVLLLGETGTGKELGARRLHAKSDRRDEPFVAMNAGCIPKELFESELFGHRKGAFTGADQNRTGLLAQAGKGTLFIDELGELPVEAQVKLLRAIEERRFRPVGSDQERPFEARLCAATLQDLPRSVEEGRFRADLYYRLSVFPLRIPPLRDRGDDVIAIARHWLGQLSGEGAPIHLLADAERFLREHPFHGNVRELINLMKRGSIFCSDRKIDAALLRELTRNSPFSASQMSDGADGTKTEMSAGAHVTLEQLERTHILSLLEQVQNVSEVARIVGIDRRTLQRKMTAWGLRENSSESVP